MYMNDRLTWFYMENKICFSSDVIKHIFADYLNKKFRLIGSFNILYQLALDIKIQIVLDKNRNISSTDANMQKSSKSYPIYYSIFSGFGINCLYYIIF